MIRTEQQIRAMALESAARLLSSQAYTTGSGGQQITHTADDVLTLADTFAKYIEQGIQGEMRRAW